MSGPESVRPAREVLTLRGGTFECWACGRELATFDLITTHLTYPVPGTDGEARIETTVPIGRRVHLAAGYTNRAEKHPSGLPWYALPLRRMPRHLPPPRKIRPPAVIRCAGDWNAFSGPMGPCGHDNLVDVPIDGRVVELPESERGPFLHRQGQVDPARPTEPDEDVS